MRHLIAIEHSLALSPISYLSILYYHHAATDHTPSRIDAAVAAAAVGGTPLACVRR